MAYPVMGELTGFFTSPPGYTLAPVLGSFYGYYYPTNDPYHPDIITGNVTAQYTPGRSPNGFGVSEGIFIRFLQADGTPTPEPSTFVLLALSSLAAWAVYRRAG